jgi:integrase
MTVGKGSEADEKRQREKRQRQSGTWPQALRWRPLPANWRVWLGQLAAALPDQRQRTLDGPWIEVQGSIAKARARAREADDHIYKGVDPLQARRKQRAQQALEASRNITFADAAKGYYASHEKKWSSHKHRQQFLNTLQQYADPVIGRLPVADVDVAAILKIVEPIWIKKYQTATRLRRRLENVLDWAAVRGHRSGDNPARWSQLRHVLPGGGEIGLVKHHKALPFAQLPAFVERLAQHQGTGPQALLFLILTGCRTSEVLKARWSEFDFANMIWTVPFGRMKSRNKHKEALNHRVPLTGQMVKLLASLLRETGDDNGLVFVGNKPNTPLGKMTLPDLIDAMGHDVTVHGFRASFKTWASEQTAYPNEIIEFCLAHVVGSASEQAYQRSDVLDKRRLLMEQWSTFVTTPHKTGTVTPIRKEAGV